jgi:predicted acylesterase/phospholipase RssA
LEGRTSLVLCGGGITGATYEIGVLAALEDFFVEFDCSQFDIYVGTSAGSFVGWMMAAGLRPKRLLRAITDPQDDFFGVQQHDIFRPEPRQLLGITRDLGSIMLTHALRSLRRGFFWQELLADLADALPAGIFSLAPYERWLERFMTRHSLPRRFEDLRQELYIPANDLDSGHRAVFGQGALQKVPIAKAICASSAIPVFFEPMRIGNRDYIDGSSGKAGHLDLALARGADLVLIINPRVPIKNDPEREDLPTAIGGAMHLRDKGFVTVWEQAERMNTKTKLHQGLRRHRAEYPRASLLAIEPREEEAEMFLSNPMSFAARRQIARYGYESATRELARRHAEFSAALARHHISCDPDRLRGLPFEMAG